MYDYIDEFNHCGFRCYTREGALGIRCGYVVIPDLHPFATPKLVDASEPRVHGGITYSSHLAEDGAGSWTIGFDCGHPQDINKRLGHTWHGATQKTWDFVKFQCRSLARQCCDAIRPEAPASPEVPMPPDVEDDSEVPLL